MQRKKNNPKLQILFAAMFLALIFVMELYAMINMPSEFLVIGVLGIVFLACIYMLIRAILLLQAEKEARREEQYENIYKSEKATFLMMKKHFEDIEEKLGEIEESSKVPTEEIVGMEKAIGKVIINRNRENAEAIINSNEVLMESFGGLKDTVAANNEKIIQSYKNINEENIQQMVVKQQEFFMGIKDMEIRLNNAIMQSQKVITQAVPVYAPPVMPAGEAPSDGTTPAKASIENTTSTEIPFDGTVPAEVSFDETAAETPAQEAGTDITVGLDMSGNLDFESIKNPVEEKAFDFTTEEAAGPAEEDHLEQIAEDVSAQVNEEVQAIPESKEPVPEPAVESVEEPAAKKADEAPSEKKSAQKPASKKAKAAKETKAPEIDTSNPNKQLGADEIEALFASMSQEATESAPEPEKDTPAPAIDLSDPNKHLSADEIAALFSSMGA
jgi:hypothetical protein